MMRSFCVFVSLIYLSSLILSVSCAGSSPILVDPKNPNIPRTQDFAQCGAPMSCDGFYYCANGVQCFLRSCRTCTDPSLCPAKAVPSCAETYKVELTAAIFSRASPRDVMIGTAYACGAEPQMVILNSVRTFKNLDVINSLPPSYANMYTPYDIQLGFFYDANPDKPVNVVISNFVDQLQVDTTSLLESHTSSVDRPTRALVNISNIQITPATFAIQRCADGTAVTGEETCPEMDPALVPNAASASSPTSTTTRLLTIILPIIGGVVFIALIIAAVVIVRRRQANKVMRQTIQHTEPAVEVTMA